MYCLKLEKKTIDEQRRMGSTVDFQGMRDFPNVQVQKASTKDFFRNPKRNCSTATYMACSVTLISKVFDKLLNLKMRDIKESPNIPA